MSSKKLDAAYEATKDTAGFWVNPAEIVVGENFARRHEEADAKKDAIALANSIFTEGQQTPAVVRKVADKLVLVAGFSRAAAVNLIRGGFEIGGERKVDGERKLLVRIDPNITDDKQAAIAAVLENVRKEVSPINTALAQKELIEKHGLTQAAVAALYNKTSTNPIAANLKLLDLTAEEQKLVHTGKLSRDTAIKLQELPADEKAVVIAEAKEKKVSSAAVTDRIAKNREQKKEETGEDDADNKKYNSRNAAALKKFINEDIVGNEAVAKDIQDIFIAVRQYLEGRCTGKTILNRIDAVK